MATTTLFSIKDVEHRDVVRSDLGNKNLVVAIYATQPLSMGFMGKSHYPHATAQIQ
jgi:hypothetical protein